jgi:hypothetical protein
MKWILIMNNNHIQNNRFKIHKNRINQTIQKNQTIQVKLNLQIKQIKNWINQEVI